MEKDKNFYIVEKSVLPEIFIKVMEVKNLLESGRETVVQDAVAKVGISLKSAILYLIFLLFFCGGCFILLIYSILCRKDFLRNNNNLF